MSHHINAIRHRLNSGWSVMPSGKSGLWAVLNPDGEQLRYPDGREFRLNPNTWDGSTTEAAVISFLRDQGAITPPKQTPKRRRRAKERHEPKKRPTQAANPILLAGAILSESQSTPRERRMARAYLELLAENEKLRELAKKLGKRLSSM